MEDALERGEIASAQKHLMDTNTLVSNLQTSTQALRVLSEINLRTADLTESLKMALVHEWDNMISLQLNGDKATLKLSGNDEREYPNIYRSLILLRSHKSLVGFDEIRPLIRTSKYFGSIN